jgi:pyridoxine 5-phosphate synthase
LPDNRHATLRDVTLLSVNLNKIALIRNARAGVVPSVLEAADICVQAGAGGITLHPRPDRRHALPQDVIDLGDALSVELNVEGNPFPEFVDLVEKVRPTQVTLVPDEPSTRTSDHGWTLVEAGQPTPEFAFLRPLVHRFKARGIRVSLFMDTDAEQIAAARDLGADRIELYTEPWARAFGTPGEDAAFERFRQAALGATRVGLGVNAGHDLNLDNLPRFSAIPGLLEVSIGHALIADAFRYGLAGTVKRYLVALGGCED